MLDNQKGPMQTHLRLIRELVSKGDHKAAAKQFHEILRVNNQNPEVLHELGLIAISIGDYVNSEHLVRLAIQLDRINQQHWLLLGYLLFIQGRLDEAEPVYEEATQLNPANAIEAQDMLGRVLLRKNNIKKAVTCFQKAVSKKIPQASISVSAFTRSLLDPQLASNGAPYIKELHNVVIDSGFWMILDGKKLYSDDVSGRNIAFSPLVRGRLSNDNTTVIVDCGTPVLDIPEPLVFLGGDENYCHWLIRYLSRLALLEGHANLRELPFLVKNNMKRYQAESLDLLDIPEAYRYMVPENSLIHCNHIYIPTNLRNERDVGIGCKWLRDKFCRNKTRTRKSLRRLYISRGDSQLRRLLNEDELVYELARRGFETIIPGDISFTQQISLFSEASVVVGPHGAGLTNIVFAPSNCLVFELTDKLISHMPDFRWIANAIGQQLITTISNDVELMPGAKLPQRDHHFRINVKDTIDLLDRHLKEIP